MRLDPDFPVWMMVSRRSVAMTIVKASRRKIAGPNSVVKQNERHISLAANLLEIRVDKSTATRPGSTPMGQPRSANCSAFEHGWLRFAKCVGLV
jgi:hypothetical protein